MVSGDVISLRSTSSEQARGFTLRRWSWACALLLACGGASKTTCQQANDKLRECQPQIDAAAATRGLRLPLSISEDCSAGDDECYAKCLAPASCAAIVVLSTGRSSDPNEPLVEAPDAGTLGDCFLACTKM